MYQRNVIIGLTREASGSELVSATDFKSYAKIDTTAEDALITNLIATARETIEKECNRSLLACSVVLTVQDFHDYIDLPYPVVDMVNGVKDVNSDYTTTARESTGFALVGQRLYNRGICGTVEISYETAAATEQAFKDAIKARTLAMYEHRGDSEDVEHHPKWIESKLMIKSFIEYTDL